MELLSLFYAKLRIKSETRKNEHEFWQASPPPTYSQRLRGGEDFCRYNASHRNKTAVYYYDATALGSDYAVNEQDFHYVVCHVIGLPLSSLRYESATR